MAFNSYGSYAICHICYWEDDLNQLLYPFSNIGSNPISLAIAQINFVQFAACDPNMIDHVRSATRDDIRDDRWFPLWKKPIDWEGIVLKRVDQQDLKPQVAEFLPYWLCQISK